MENCMIPTAAMKLLPSDITEFLETINVFPDEIRLRIGRPVTLTSGSKSVITNSRPITNCDLETVVSRVFRNSLHSFSEQLCSGYMTCEGGLRVGFSGTASSQGGKVENIRNFSSVNIRIPREIKGCAVPIFENCLKTSPSSLLMCGAPSSGKTTFLRDLTRLCGSLYRTSLIDERGEIAASSLGVPYNDTGMLTDIFDSYPRKAAIETAVRVMSPQIIVCDEIGSADDLLSLEYAVNSGVKLICTCHCTDIESLYRKPNISKLLKAGVFEHLVSIAEHRIVKIVPLADRYD